MILSEEHTMSTMKTLEDLYYHELQDMYSAEEQLTKALPDVIAAAKDSKLKTALKEHLEETKGQRDKVGKLLKSHGQTPGEETCKAMQGLVKETEATMKEDMTPELLDAALIACCQRVEHYEMAGYGTCRAYAQALDMKDDVKVISEIFDQEESADGTLTKIAVNVVNPKVEA